MARNTQKLKTLIFNTLNNDLTLRGLLCGTGRVKHGNPENLSEYPCVTYQILNEEDEPYGPDEATFMTKARVIVTSFVANASPLLAGKLDDRVQVLLHGVQLSDTNVQVYSSYRSAKNEKFDSSVDVWTIQSSYDIVTVTK